MFKKHLPATITNSREIVIRQGVRQSIVQGSGKLMAMSLVKTGMKQSLKQVVKVTTSPGLWMGDMAEVGVRQMTGSQRAGKATSLGFYMGTGALTGGPVGVAIATGIWGISQVVERVWSSPSVHT